MPVPDQTIHPPAVLTVFSGGRLDGRTAFYRKQVGDLDGVYLDNAAWQAERNLDADRLVYSVEEQRYDNGPGALVVGTSTLLPGRVSTEFALTRGHLHAVSDRAELYYCLSGHGVMLLETVDGDSTAIELTAGQAVNVPGQWIHRSVNVGADPFVTLFSYAADAVQNYGIISEAGGMKMLVVTDGADGWTTVPNPRHTGYQRTAAS